MQQFTPQEKRNWIKISLKKTYVLGKIKRISNSQSGYDAFIKIYNKDKSKFLIVSQKILRRLKR